MMKKAIAAIMLAGAFMVPTAALAAASAIATADVNLRAGPSTRYPVITVVGNRDNVRVYGCLSNRSWCDIGYRGNRGWMSSNYLAYLEGGRRISGPSVVPMIGAPIIGFSVGNYWDRHYRNRSFYRHRDRWYGRHFDRPRHHRPRWHGRPHRPPHHFRDRPRPGPFMPHRPYRNY
ncbi:SH3 domain-containing protein [Consotaella salsifontis]|uniref:Uncharacterized conserved protein YraI n=1 Tax=Consotaella salsifontis TaxID=1365950 RepID=A0A1T4QNZ0_9HYPH|nr:SH3 domain-containing protein [Consotaella salsifontis]SKA05480.1 Uncharacterized conserved protein YraI [Consotaella salsifontis]